MTHPLNSQNKLARDGTRAKAKAPARSAQSELPGVVQPTIERTACHRVPPSARIGEPVSYRSCPRCHRHVLTAMCAGILTRCDPENLTIAGELKARLSGLLTFDIHVEGVPRRMYLEYRDLMRISIPRRRPVVAQHRCRNELTLETGFPANAEIVVPFRSGPLPETAPF